MIGGAPRSEVLGQIAPLTASLDDIEDPVEQLAERVLAWPSRLAGLGETIVDELPFAVRQIRCVSHPQSAGASGQKSTAKYAVLLGFLSFQTGSKAGAGQRWIGSNCRLAAGRRDGL